MVSRRNFMGATLGSLVLTRLPWLAEPPPMAMAPPDPAHAASLRLMFSTDEEIKQSVFGVLQAGWTMHDEHVIASPSILRVRRSVWGGVAILSLEVDSVEASECWVSRGLGLCLRKNGSVLSPIAAWPYGPYYLQSGDTLRPTYDISGEGMSPAEIRRFESLIP